MFLQNAMQTQHPKSMYRAVSRKMKEVLELKQVITFKMQSKTKIDVRKIVHV